MNCQMMEKFAIYKSHDWNTDSLKLFSQLQFNKFIEPEDGVDAESLPIDTIQGFEKLYFL